jgi:hypothetical protein
MPSGLPGRLRVWAAARRNDRPDTEASPQGTRNDWRDADAATREPPEHAVRITPIATRRTAKTTTGLLIGPILSGHGLQESRRAAVFNHVCPRQQFRS